MPVKKDYAPRERRIVIDADKVFKVATTIALCIGGSFGFLVLASQVAIAAGWSP